MKRQEITKVTTVHPEGDMKVPHGNPSKRTKAQMSEICQSTLEANPALEQGQRALG